MNLCNYLYNASSIWALTYKEIALHVPKIEQDYGGHKYFYYEIMTQSDGILTTNIVFKEYDHFNNAYSFIPTYIGALDNSKIYASVLSTYDGLGKRLKIIFLTEEIP